VPKGLGIYSLLGSALITSRSEPSFGTAHTRPMAKAERGTVWDCYLTHYYFSHVYSNIAFYRVLLL
jgi:hypothetical protein